MRRIKVSVSWARRPKHWRLSWQRCRAIYKMRPLRREWISLAPDGGLSMAFTGDEAPGLRVQIGPAIITGHVLPDPASL